jgi:hypothetical protein
MVNEFGLENNPLFITSPQAIQLLGGLKVEVTNEFDDVY